MLLRSAQHSTWHIISVQLISHVRFFVTPWTTARQASLSITNTKLEFARTHVHRVCDAIQPAHTLSSPSPPAFSLSQHQGLSWNSSPGLLFLTFSYSCLVTRHFSTLLILGLACCLCSSSLWGVYDENSLHLHGHINLFSLHPQEKSH